LVALLPLVQRIGCPLIALTGSPVSLLGGSADVHLDVSIRQEACPLGLAPTASTTAALAMGDALAMALLERRGFSVEDFAVLHPGGRLGRKLLRVADLMHRGEEIPRVPRAAPMKDVLFEMTSKRLGVTAVAESDGRILGVISDGDLRRQMERNGYAMLDATAETCMTPDPVLIEPAALVVRALELMEERRITSLLVAEAGTLVGVVHLHDLWKTQLV
jgi:arabinose-5-phosphate isomerase